MRAFTALAFAAFAAFSAGGCLRKTEFHCMEASQCGGGAAMCMQGFCAFPNPDCSSGYSFDPSAGDLAGKCVGDTLPDDDAPPPPMDGDPDAPPAAGCPGTYNELPGGSPHRYLVLAVADDWLAQRGMCRATSSSAYLAIPDDATELMGLSGIAGAATYWVGVSDRATENTFLNDKDQPQTFLPWAPGAPDDDPPGEDCVAALSAANQFNDDRCMTNYRAICECEP
jgi:hypothetical protein